MWKYSLFSIFLSINLFAQNKQILIEYKFSDSNITRIDTLVATETNMVFDRGNSFKDIGFSKRSELIKNDSEIKSNKVEVNLSKSKFYSSNHSDSLLIKFQNSKKAYLILDIVPIIDWEIKNEFKAILGIKCRKAEGNFRGSSIIAWYSEKIKIPFGPWKFKGLPGIILEIFNENNFNSEKWTAQNIILPYSEKINYLMLVYKEIDFIKYEQFVINRENKIQEQISRFQSRAPVGVTMTKSSVNRVGIEKVYEWETENEKK
jgi:GLPGLI family protein